jgi:hypothetical protein
LNEVLRRYVDMCEINRGQQDLYVKCALFPLTYKSCYTVPKKTDKE